MTYTTLTLDRSQSVATITLNRPPVNAISLSLLNELETALAEVERDDSLRVVVITGGEARLFSAGADFQEFAGDSVREFQAKGGVLFDVVEHFRKPVIAAVNGGAYGGGFELAMACHLRFLADTAQLALTEVKLGIVPGWGGTQRLPRLIGRTRAMEYLLTGDRIDAQDAMIFGLVNRVYARDHLLAETQAFAARLAQGAPLAMAAIIDCVARGLELDLADGMAIEAAHALELGQTEDAMIGVMSAVQKTQPEFKGR